MEVDITYRPTSCLSPSASTWRTTSEGTFPRSPKEEDDDEEALKRAALENLPTYNSPFRKMITNSSGEATEADDVSTLGPQGRQKLIDKLVREPSVDNEHFLLKLRDRFDA